MSRTGGGGSSRAMSKFVSACLGYDGVQGGHKIYTGLGGMSLRSVRWWPVLLCTRVLVVGVKEFERGSHSQVSCAGSSGCDGEVRYGMPWAGLWPPLL